MTTMRQRYIDDMCLRGLLPRTQKVFLHYFDAFCSQLECAPERTDREHLRAYLFALVDRGCARTTVLTAQNALRFFYRVTLERDWPANFLIFSIKRRRLLHDRNVTS